jgi:hypothetical protein
MSRKHGRRYGDTIPISPGPLGTKPRHPRRSPRARPVADPRTGSAESRTQGFKPCGCCWVPPRPCRPSGMTGLSKRLAKAQSKASDLLTVDCGAPFLANLSQAPGEVSPCRPANAPATADRRTSAGEGHPRASALPPPATQGRRRPLTFRPWRPLPGAGRREGCLPSRSSPHGRRIRRSAPWRV